MNYDGFGASLNFNSYQGTIYVSFHANLGQLMGHPHKPYSMKCTRGKQSRMRRRKKREESRQLQVTEYTSTTATSESLLDLDVPAQCVPVLSNNSEDLEVNIEVEVDDRSAQVSDSNCHERSDIAVPENHTQTTKTSQQEDSQYWDQMSAMLRYLVDKSSPPSSIDARAPTESRPFHVQNMQQPSFYQHCESKNPEVCNRPIAGRPLL